MISESYQRWLETKGRNCRIACSHSTRARQLCKAKNTVISSAVSSTAYSGSRPQANAPPISTP